MRLSKIKLAGFKSFVDPTTIPLPSNLVGIVGPNGCGKSNTIDAVRWVMGESSAKHLRGENITDVIFNGSTSRKPVGQASIELVFDNSDNTLGGQYAQYSEISVKRVVSRDGLSNYYLNNTRCRRRDITDLFLGTGLGPRSYAIIEQGTISRLIEAKPEELRVFIEEAAGISKYKERRRETENRIRHTRDNLDRLNDLRDELDKQLAHLKRQANTAEKYKVLKDEERLLKAQLQALRWQIFDQSFREREKVITEGETQIEAEVAKQRNIEAQTIELREKHGEASEGFAEVQKRFYSVGNEIARLEQALQHTRELRQQQEQDLHQLEASWADIQKHQQADEEKVAELKRRLEENTPRLEQLQQSDELASAQLQEAEQAMAQWQQQWDEFNRAAAEPAQLAQVERTRIQNLEQQFIQLEGRLKKLRDEMQGQNTAQVEQQIQQASEALALNEEQAEQLQTRLLEQVENIRQQREASHGLNNQLDEARNKLQTLRGRQASLEALQQAALGKQQGKDNQWLEQQGLLQSRRLAEGISVETGWEQAAETVLGPYLEAVNVDNLERYLDSLQAQASGDVTLFAPGSNAGNAGEGKRLLAKLSSDWDLSSLVGHIYTADTVAEALALRGELASHESVITKEGLWLGPAWVRVAHGKDEHAGVLQREQELKQLAEEIKALQATQDELQQNLESGRGQLNEAEQQREALQQELNQLNRQVAEHKATISGAQARLEQVRQREAAVSQELADLEQQAKDNEQQQAEVRARLNEALARMDQDAGQRETLSAQREEIQNRLNDVRQQAREQREQMQNQAMQNQAMQSELTAIEQARVRMEQQLEHITRRREELKQVLAAEEDPIQGLTEDLSKELEVRSGVEKELEEARKSLEAIDHELRQLDKAKGEVEQTIQAARSQLEGLRITLQETRIRRQTTEEKIIEIGYELQGVLQEMPEGAEEPVWEKRVNDIGIRIQRLGAINLAAIEEFEQQSERKVYLDAQHEDLVQALETLENAIRKIDRETRTRFKETFDKVNTGLQEMFPRLFGGGHAYLELTGEDLLEAGVAVMARPPGKRNSTIHLLSGGEKALTAVAMVFSIFQLNPAPFCMLDEVDAPLDDANVGRFCDMVKEMSNKTQFIFITHNKITMELAQQLNGVTMKEPGVSRLVAVDVDEAAELAVANG